MLIIICALSIEAKPIVDWLSLKRDHSINSHQVYRNDSVSLIVSGVGVLNAAIATSILIGEFPESKLVKKPLVLNIGFCASKNKKIGILELINKITYLENDYYPELNLNFKLNESSIITVDSPVTNTNLMNDEALYDMEAYGVYSATSKLINSTSAYFLKIVADNGDDSYYNKEKAKELFSLNKDSILKTVKVLLNHSNNQFGMLREDYRNYQDLLKASSLSVTQANHLSEPILTALSLGASVSDILSSLNEIKSLKKAEITPFVDSYIKSLNI